MTPQGLLSCGVVLYFLQGGDNVTNDEIVERITANESAVKSAQHQIDEMKELINCIHELVSVVSYMQKDINKMQTDIDTIKSKPNKRYEQVVATVITAFTSGFVGYLISNIFN